MPVILIRGGVALLLATYLFISGLTNFQPNEKLNVIYYREENKSIVFYVVKEKTKNIPLEVIIPKQNNPNSKIKISIKDKRQDMEFDIEHIGEISEEHKVWLDQILNTINESAKSKPTLKDKFKKVIKDYLNKKL